MSRLRTENRDEYLNLVRVLRRIDPSPAGKGWRAAGVPGAVPNDLASLWDDLAGSNAFRADLAIWRLAGGGPQTVALVSERLRPPLTLTKEQVARLIADLDSDSFDTRENACSELARSLDTPPLRCERHAPRIRRRKFGGVSIGSWRWRTPRRKPRSSASGCEPCVC